MDEAKYHDILMKEWIEAGTLCRSIEQLTRTSLALFLPTATLIAGIVVSSDVETLVKLAVSVAGFAYAVLLGITVLRNQAYYRTYVKRANEIEKLIKNDGVSVLSLYSMGAKVKHSTPISNKDAIAAVFLIAAIFFFGVAAQAVAQIGLVTPTYINDAGLLLDIFGAVLLFKFGLPAPIDREGLSYLTTDKSSPDDEAKGKRYDKWSKVGVMLLLLGFALQLVSNHVLPG